MVSVWSRPFSMIEYIDTVECECKCLEAVGLAGTSTSPTARARGLPSELQHAHVS